MGAVLPWLARIFAAAAETLGLLSALTTIATAIRNDLIPVAVEHAPYATTDNVTSALLNITDFRTAWDLWKLGNDADIAAIMAAIGLTQQAANPVTLPTTPPAGYGAPSTSDIADQVWNGPLVTIPSTPADALLQAVRGVNSTGVFDQPLYVGIFRVARIDWGTSNFYITSLSYPTFDPTDILVGETLIACLTRQNPTWNVGANWGPQDVVTLDPTDGSMVHYTTIFGETEFDAYRERVHPVEKLTASPAWPGLAFVTLGVPVAISTGFTITEAMHGVIVNLTSEPSKSSFFTFDDVNSYRNLGALSFTSDNGDQEPSQTLGFTSAVYSPKSMVKAAGVKLRFVGGVSGTVTPWLITAAA